MGDPPQKRGFSGKNRKNGTYGAVESFPKTDFLIPRIFYLTRDMTKVRWNDQLVTYFSLMCRYGINTNILHLTFSRAEF